MGQILARNSNGRVLAAVLLALPLVMCATASAQIYTDIHDFLYSDGSSPSYPQVMAQGRDGNLYGTTPAGGLARGGVMFRMTPDGILTPLFNFGGSTGSEPYSGLTLGLDGNFYGTTVLGGVNNLGEIFQMTPDGFLTVLYSFTGGSDGAYPYATPVLGNDGNFYGLTKSATAYRITPAGVFTLLGSIPGQSFAPLILGTDGNFYGTTQHGGAFNQGTVFAMTPAGTVKIIYSFDSSAHGGVPWGGVVQAGNYLFGTTSDGGSGNGGVVFRLTPSGNLAVIHNFPEGSQNDGSDPQAGLLFATDGTFYGSTFFGGTDDFGVLFKIGPTGQQYSFIYQFDKLTGEYSSSSLVQHTNGSVYGMAQGGGQNQGVVFSLALNLGARVKPLLSTGKVGSVVQILGSGFTGATLVNFKGASVVPNVISDTFLIARVPSRAQSGTLSVVTPTGTIPSMSPFLVVPMIVSFSPTSGPVGTPVVITGNSFTGATKVTFGGVSATSFTVNSNTQITAIVPKGARTGKIGLTAPGGTAKSSGIFTVTG